MMQIKLNAIKTISAQLTLMSGLRIGAGDTEIHIGGVDNSVIKHPLTQIPYIPGSSLKGKIRSLLELKTGRVKEGPLGKKDLPASTDPIYNEVLTILKLFGTAAEDAKDDSSNEIFVTRLAFRDCSIQADWQNLIENNGGSYVEVKAENSINRISGVANNPRTSERVIEGTVFDFNLSLKVFDGDNEDQLVSAVIQGLRLLELDTLGGSGSRGYGKVKFTSLEIDGVTYDQTTFDAINPFER